MNVRYIDYRSKEADKYIESDKFLKNTYGSRRDRDQYNGEIAIDGDEVAGYIFVGDKVDKGFINSLKVYDNYRRNGIASKLLNDAIHKYGGVDLTVKKDNTIAVNMYKKRGFAEDPDYTHGNMMYMKLSKVKNESTLQEAVDPLTALGTVVLGVNAAIKIFSKIDERKRNKSYYLSAELNGKPKATYNSPEVAIVFYAYDKGVRHGDLKTIFVNDHNRKALDDKVYLYKEFNSKSKLIKSGTFESLCKSYGISIKKVDTSNADYRKKVYAKAQSLLRSKLPSNIKSKGKFYSANDEDEKEFYKDFINSISNSTSLFYASLWDIDKEARTHEHEGKNNSTIWEPLSKCVKDVSKELPKGYKVTFDGGDWDDILIDIVYSDSIKESVSLQEAARSELPESEFGVPSKKKFPLDSAAHVKSAIRFFNYVEPEDEAELAKRIKKKAKEFGVPIRCGKKNRLSKYITKEYVNEFMAASAIGNDAYAVINGSIKQSAYQNGFQYTEDDEYPYTKKKKAKIHKNNMMKNDFTEE